MSFTSMERAALEHVKEYLRYENSPQAAIDRAKDKAERAANDIRAGHTPECTLARCASTCARYVTRPRA